MFSALWRALILSPPVFAKNAGVMTQQTRNTFILKRRFPAPLSKKYDRPKILKSRHFVYDLVKDTNTEKQVDISIIMKEFVEGVGQKGDLITMRPQKAYRDFLVPGLAVYASPLNIERFNASETAKEDINAEFSSIYVQRTISCLSRTVLQISMNKIEPWELEKWHIRASFRKCMFVVPEHAIEMPPHKITGPDLSLQDKEFYVTVTINNKEKVNVRCRINHWACGLERLPHEHEHWKRPREPLFAEQAEVLQSMPLPIH